ncbi:hypothetical protein [Streptomyces griseosporeus]|uniref:hypothetical protein n=1 Tax=Streptomyces griseosporeus TaxID=1910 RepID=UPI0036FF1C1C
MSETWEAIFPATAAGVFGILGILAGIVVGRRQTTDQAAVEHGQWLRGQRQQAYTGLLAAWDTALRQLTTCVEVWDDRMRSMDMGAELWEVQQAIHRDVAGAWEVLAKPAELASLLGPPRADAALMEMDRAFREATDYLMACSAEHGPRLEVDEWNRLVQVADNARGKFLAAARHALRTHPRPGGE